MAVLTLVLLAIVYSMSAIQDTWLRTHSRVREFREARVALDTLGRRISQSVLDTRWVPNSVDEPQFWLRDSDLHFVCGPATTLLSVADRASGHAIFFQAPMNYTGLPGEESEYPRHETLPGILNAWGYFIEFGEDPRRLPDYLLGGTGGRPAPAQRYRFRLMEFRQPAHQLTLFKMQPASGNQESLPLIRTLTSQQPLYEWFNEPLKNYSDPVQRHVAVVAENILAVVISPRDPAVAQNREVNAPTEDHLAPEYLYDSRRFQWEPTTELADLTRHRLPPALQLTVIALDETAWSRLSESEARTLGEQLRQDVNTRFRNARYLDQDLGSLEGELNRRKIGYRIINSLFALPGGNSTTDRERQTAPTTASTAP